MTDTAAAAAPEETASVTAAPPAPPTGFTAPPAAPSSSSSAPAPPAAFTADQVSAMIDAAVAKAVAATAPATPAKAAPAPAPAAENLYTKGNLVSYTYFDPYTGRDVTRFGIVIETHPSEDPTVGARSSVAWLADASGAIGDNELAAV